MRIINIIRCAASSRVLSLIICLVTAACYPEESSPEPNNYIIQGPQDLYPALSPDGTTIAYYHDAWDQNLPGAYASGLYLVDSDGGNKRLIVEGSYSSPAWSPDGKWLVFSAGGTITKCTANGDSISTFKGIDSTPLFNPDWSPVGELVLFDRTVNEAGSLFQMTSDFEDPSLIFGIKIVSGRDAELSPDGTHFVYLDWQEDRDFSEIFLRDTGGKVERQLTVNKKDDRAPSWSPDGKQIVWSSNSALWVMNIDGSEQRQLTYGNDPSWSKNNVIVFSHANSDYSKEVLYIISPDGTNRMQITF